LRGESRKEGFHKFVLRPKRTDTCAPAPTPSPKTQKLIPNGLNHPARGWPIHRGLPWGTTPDWINPEWVESQGLRPGVRPCLCAIFLIHSCPGHGSNCVLAL
jgi:hypothetical protein